MKTLAYHSIGDSVKEVGAGLYCVPEDAFRKQLDYLRGKDVLITFDDGDITNYTKAYPVLKESQRTAYFFIIGEWIGTAGYMNWGQIKELQRAGMTIGSHGMTHRILTGLSDDELKYEFDASKKMLEDNLKTPIETISIPRGLYNAKIIDMIKKIGYKKIFTSDLNDSSDVIFGRMAVKEDWSVEYFMNAVEKGPSFREKAAAFIKNSSRKIIGDKNYDLLRTKMLK